MLKRLFFLFLLWSPLIAESQTNPLDLYIQQGLSNNLALQQKGFSLEKSLEALREAKGMFLPSIAIQARYSRAGGGRMIDLPIGDLMNPVYSSLNQLFNAHGIDSYFPTSIPNQSFPFLRKKEQETKIRIIQPILQPAIYHNLKLRSSLSQIQDAELAAFERHLIADIQAAYYSYVQSCSVVELLQKTKTLLEENLRVSQNLLNQGKATEDVLYRAQAALADLDQKRADAKKNKILASQYFNFLLNRELDAEIGLDLELLDQTPEAPDLETATQHALAHRDEFRQLRNATDAAMHQARLANSGALPSVLAVVDLGFQGEDYRLGSEDDFWMASVILEWNVFNGGQNKAKKAQALLERKKLEVQTLELEKQIQLQVQESFHALHAARLSMTAAADQEKAARKSFEIVAKKYEFGMAPQIEYFDAQTTLTQASTNRIIAKADFLIKRAQFEQASAWVNLEYYK